MHFLILNPIYFLRLQSNQKILNPNFDDENTAAASPEPVLRNVVDATFDDMKQMVIMNNEML